MRAGTHFAQRTEAGQNQGNHRARRGKPSFPTDNSRLIVVIVVLLVAVGYGGWRFYIDRQTVGSLYRVR